MHVDKQRIEMNFLPSCLIRQIRAPPMRLIDHIIVVFLIYIIQNIRRISSIFRNTINGHILPYAWLAQGSTKAKEQKKTLHNKHVRAKFCQTTEFSGYTLQNISSLVRLNFYLLQYQSKSSRHPSSKHFE